MTRSFVIATMAVGTLLMGGTAASASQVAPTITQYQPAAPAGPECPWHPGVCTCEDLGDCFVSAQ